MMDFEITQEMVDKASQEELEVLAQSPEVLMAQNQHLNNRVVLLRALVNEQQKEIESLKTRRPRKQATKKTASSE